MTYWHLVARSVTYCYLLLPTVTYWDVLSPTVTYWDVLSPTGTYCHLLSPTVTYSHLQSPTDMGALGNLEVLGKWLNLTSKSFLTLLAGEEEEETVEPDAPPLGNGRIKSKAEGKQK